MNITWWQFWDLNPHIIKCMEKAHHQKVMEIDAIVHAWIGSYGINAMVVALDKVMNGRKASAKYIDKPLITKAEEENRPLTQEEIERQRAIFVEQLKLKKANFDLHHKNKTKDSSGS